MLFTSFEFIIFLGIVIAGYYIIPKRLQWIFLLAASYIFYCLASPVYLIYIAVTTLSVYFCTKIIQARKDNFDVRYNGIKKKLDRQQKKDIKAKEKKRQFRIMLGCLLFNLAILAVCKYTNFVIDNINYVLGMAGSMKILLEVDIILPMGISFYTFQSLGYLIDVYRGTCKAETNLGKFALFVSFFPQLVQGPISRFNDLSKSLFESHKADYSTITFGLQRILWGFFKKLVIADRIAAAVRVICGDASSHQGAFVLIGMLFYALELYADFTGGIDIAIGVAQTLGITVTENFIRPFFSKNIKEYWNRWHITMGSWFTDYIFYPISICKPMLKLSKFSRKHLGEFIGKRVPIYLSSFTVWFATGIWHGASWNFVVWGLGNFIVIMISQECEPLYRWFHSKFNVRGKFVFRLFQIIRTVLLMSFLRMFDCYRDVCLTFKMYGSMFMDFSFKQLSPSAFLSLGIEVSDYIILILSTVLLTTVSLFQRSGSVRERIAAKRAPVRFIIWYGLFLAVLIFGAYGIGYEESQFIYNQF